MLDLALIAQAVSEMFENNGNVNVYSPGEGADNPLGQIFFKNINLSIKTFKAKFTIK